MDKTARVWDGVSNVTTPAGVFTPDQFRAALPKITQWSGVLLGENGGIAYNVDNLSEIRVALNLPDASEDTVVTAYAAMLNAPIPDPDPGIHEQIAQLQAAVDALVLDALGGV